MISQRTIYTAIIGPYEKLKEPNVANPMWNHLCYTDQDLKSDVWNIVKIPTPEDPRRQARIIKALFYNYVDSFQSIYLDGSFQINCDLTAFWLKYYKQPFSCPSHPQRNDVYEEAQAVLAGKRGGREKVEEQVESYRGIVPPNNGLITSGILLREKRSTAMDLCAAWINETLQWSLRDQISFAKVSMGKQFHTFDYKYNLRDEFIYHPHSDKIIDGVNHF